MVIKNFSVSLEEEVVEKAKENIQKYGGKLSPLINEFLIRFNDEHEEGGKNGN